MKTAKVVCFFCIVLMSNNSVLWTDGHPKDSPSSLKFKEKYTTEVKVILFVRFFVLYSSFFKQFFLVVFSLRIQI